MTLQREDRYIVIKRSDLNQLSYTEQRVFGAQCRALHERIFKAGAPARQFLVIESDWPEYEPAWAMIEARVAGKQVEPTGWLDPATGDFLTLKGRANTLATGHGDRLERYSVALYAAQPAPTVLPPDDQDEINRLHAEFIAIDEPNNEQVLAFQDASYALGVKRGQGDLARQSSKAEDWRRAANKYSDSMCLLGELLSVPEDDQSTGAVFDAVRALKAREAALQQRLNEADQKLDDATAVLRVIYNRGQVGHYGMTKIEDFFSQLTKDSPEVGS